MELATTSRSHPEERLLIHELTHRINNEFTCAVDMMSLAAARSTNAEVKATLAAVTDRLLRYAAVHRALQMPKQGTDINASAYFRELCRSISQSKLDRKNIDLVFIESPLSLEAEQCWRLGMIVYELITNAARHAFREAGGEIRVEIVRVGRFVECYVSDDGTPPSFVRRGSGRKIIEDLATSLDGRFDQQFGARGSVSVVVFPVIDAAKSSAQAQDRGCQSDAAF